MKLFNHYILRGHETGFYMGLFRRQHSDLYTKRNYEMPEPGPLGFTNVVFSYMCLGIGIGFSLIQVLVEFVSSCIRKRKEWKLRKTRESRRWAQQKQKQMEEQKGMEG